MNDFIFIFFTISVVTGLIYFLYKLMLGSEGGKTEDVELQITSKELLEQLSILYKQKKYNIVESLAKKYLDKKPKDDDVRVLLARTLHAVKRVYEAIDQLKVVLKHQPKNAEVQIFFANCYAEVEKPMKAITIFQEILDVDSSNVVAIKELAQLFLSTNQKQSAIKMYEQLDAYLDSNSEKVTNKSIIAEIYVGFNEYNKAIAQYKGILEIYPDDTTTKMRLVELYRLTSNFDSIIALASELSTTATVDVEVLWALNALMDAYLAMKNYEKALEYANLINDNPLSDKTELGEDIANILFHKGQLDDCIQILKDLIEQDPENLELKKALARAYEKTLNFELAVEIYKEILQEADVKKIGEVQFEISNLYANWGLYLFSQNDSSECFKKFSVALEYYTQNPNTYSLLGQVNKLIKNYNEAISQYKKAIELDNENAEYFYELAECYEQIDSIYEQKKALVDCIKRDPKNAKAYYKLGVIFYIQNDSPKAVTNLKTSIELDSKCVEPKHKLALILEHIGSKAEAIAVYESILKLQPENEEIINNLKMLKD